MASYFLALGSNIGDRETNFRSALDALAARGVSVTRSASVYSTEPKEMLEQPWFLNTVIEVETALAPADLMRVCLEIEAECGRQRKEPNGPRTLDIDIILSEDHVVGLESVAIPHPRYAERRFVVEPLAELAPDVIDPVRRQSVREILNGLVDESEVRRVGPPLI